MQTLLLLTMQGAIYCCHLGAAATRPPRPGTRLRLGDSSDPSPPLTGTGMLCVLLLLRLGFYVSSHPILAALAQGVCRRHEVVVVVPLRAEDEDEDTCHHYVATGVRVRL